MSGAGNIVSYSNNLEGEELDFLKELAQRYHSWLQADL